MFKWMVLLAAFFTGTTWAQDETLRAPRGSRSIGHNVSTTTTTLRKNEFSLGTFYVGYGLWREHHPQPWIPQRKTADVRRL